MSCQCKDKNRRNYYTYYDTPDGCDVDKKVMVTARYGAMAGLVLSTFDVMMYSHAVGLGHIMRRFAFHMGHPALMGATFAIVANAAQHWRQKDDSLNYFLGGLACGPILASYLGSMHAVLLGGIGLGVIGKIKKDAVDSNWILFPQIKSHMGSVNGWRHDYTLAKDPLDGMCAKELSVQQPNVESPAKGRDTLFDIYWIVTALTAICMYQGFVTISNLGSNVNV